MNYCSIIKCFPKLFTFYKYLRLNGENIIFIVDKLYNCSSLIECWLMIIKNSIFRINMLGICLKIENINPFLSNWLESISLIENRKHLYRSENIGYLFVLEFNSNLSILVLECTCLYTYLRIPIIYIVIQNVQNILFRTSNK